VGQSTQSDFEVAWALQLDEGAAVAGEAAFAAAASGLTPSRQRLYVVEPCTAMVRCRGCGEQVRRQAPRLLFQWLGQRKLNSVHLGCLGLIRGLVRPRPPRSAPSLASLAPAPAGPGAAEGDVLLSELLSDADRAVAEVQLSELPEGPASVQCFEWPPPPRPPSRRTELRQQLLLTDRDFTPEDYDVLLELDRGGSGGRRGREESAAQAQGLLARLPVSTLTEASASAQCSICLEDMAAGAEVRTLPCMHVFHRKCIDRWLTTPGPPRCPVDQTEVEA